MPRKDRSVHDPLAGAAQALEPVAEGVAEAAPFVPVEGVIYRRLVSGEKERQGDVSVGDNLWIRPLGCQVSVLYVGAESVLKGARDGSFDRPFAELGEAVASLARSGCQVFAVYGVPTGELLRHQDPEPWFDVARYLETKHNAYLASQGIIGPQLMADALQRLHDTNSLGPESQDE